MISRAVIEQAKGIIMAQNRCDADEAFEVLRLNQENLSGRQYPGGYSCTAGSSTPSAVSG